MGDEKLVLSECNVHHLPGALGDSGAEDKGSESGDQGEDQKPWGFEALGDVATISGWTGTSNLPIFDLLGSDLLSSDMLSSVLPALHGLSAMDAGSDVTLRSAGAPLQVVLNEDVGSDVTLRSAGAPLQVVCKEVAAPSDSTDFGSVSEQSEERDDELSSEENRPSSANRAVTPPPGHLMKQWPVTLPPGLGLEVSPMKVEYPCKDATLGSAMPLCRVGLGVGSLAEAEGLSSEVAASLWQPTVW